MHWAKLYYAIDLFVVLFLCCIFPAMQTSKIFMDTSKNKLNLVAAREEKSLQQYYNLSLRSENFAKGGKVKDVTPVHANKFLIFSKGCRILQYDVLSPIAQKHFKEIGECKAGLHDDVYYEYISREGKYIYYDKEYFKRFYTSTNCSYITMRREEPTINNLDKNLDLSDAIIDNEWKPLEQPIVEEEAEYIMTYCRSLPIGKKIVDYWKYVVETVLRKRPEEVKERSSEQNPSLLILGMPRVSRANAHRHLNKTLELLLSTGFEVAKGLTSTATDDFNAIIPLLTGLDSTEFSKNCSDNGVVDNCQYLWNKFRENDYLTAFIEDHSGGLFNSNNFKFRTAPTDYYSHPFIYNYEKCCHKHTLLCNTTDGRAFTTLNSWLPLKHYLVHAYKIVTLSIQHNLPLFGFFWSSSVPWTEINPPYAVDNLYHAFFESILAEGAHTNSIIVFLSAMGARDGEFVLSPQGKHESNLPFAYIYFPQWFKNKYKIAASNFESNIKNRMITAYDLHASFQDLLNEKKLAMISNHAPPNIGKAASLFYKISENRNCKKGGVPPTFCPCTV